MRAFLNADISKWDVSRVTDMNSIFANTIFNCDISKWDVSTVIDMDDMLMGAEKINKELCGAGWVHS